MDILKPFRKLFQKEIRPITGGSFGFVKGLTGESWSDAKNISAYGKSLYVYACVSKIAEKVASIDFKLNKIINSDGDVEEVKSHEILDLLYRWNPYFTKEEAIEIDTINRKLTGDSFIYKVRNNAGQVVELWNIRPDRVNIVSSREEYISHYEIINNDGTREKIDPSNIIHIKAPSPLNEYFGISPLSAAGNRVQVEGYAIENQRDLFLNSARPDGVLTTEEPLTPEQREQLGDDFNKRHKGVGKNSKLAVLDSGLKYQQVSLSPREMDFIESLKATRDDILTAFKVPKPIVAVTDDVNLANSKTAQEIFLSETIVPEMNKLVNKLNEELIIPEYGEEYFLTFEDPAPISREARLAEFTAGCDKWISRNEIRQILGMEAIPGGDVLYTQIANVPIEGGANARESKAYKNLRGRRTAKIKLSMKQTIEKQKEQFKKDAKEISESSLFKDKEKRLEYHRYYNKMTDNQADKLKRAMIAKKNEQKDEILKALKRKKPKTKADIKKIFNLEKQVKDFKDWALPHFYGIFKQSGEDAMRLISMEPFTIDKAINPNTKQKIAKLLEKRALFFAKSVNDTTLSALVDTLSEGITTGESIKDLSKRVNNTYLDFNKYRAERIARTETNAVVNEANLEAYRQADAEGKEWIATLDDRVRDEHLMMDGEIVPVDKPFSNGLMAPNEINCRCAIAPIFKIVK